MQFVKAPLQFGYLPVTHVVQEEYFDSYSTYPDVFAHASQPVAVIHQWFEAGTDTGPHQHKDFYALYLGRGGHGLHTVNGHPYPITRGDVYITPPGSIHSYCAYHHLQAEALIFQAQLFSAVELDALRSLAGFWNLFIPAVTDQVDTGRDYQLHLSPERYRIVEGMVQELFAEITQPAPVSAILMRGLLFRLLVYLARLQAEDGLSQNGRDAAFDPAVKTPAGGPGLAEVLRICEERFAEPLSVPQLAALMFLSPSYFSEIFSREVGMPPAAYIRRLRLERAQTLLRSTWLSATEIAQQVGLNDSAQLSRAFRAAFGMTPTDYRALFNKERA